VTFRPPGTHRPSRFRPQFHWELLVCGVAGHELIGLDASKLREKDAVFAREIGGRRWYRCVRCDSWLPLPPPEHPSREFPPSRDEVELPLRGRALRDTVMLRIIAIDRAIHFVLLAALAALLLVFSNHVRELHRLFVRVVADYGGSSHVPRHGFVHELERLVTLQSGTLRIVALGAAAYAVLEGAEAVGLWYMKRWAEYLTFVATTALLPLEVYELTKKLSAFKIVAIVVNVAIVVYLLFAKRLFGLRGGAEAEERERQRDVGWDALERTSPPVTAPPGAVAGSAARPGSS
jgi:uncharacterized membrane protein (DUF2068 family)